MMNWFIGGMRFFALVLLVLIFPLFLSGCLFAGKTVTYHYDDKQDPNRVTSVTEQGTFAESENLANHYDSLNQRTNALINLHNTTPYKTDTERTQGAVITALIIRDMSNAPAPMTMTDVMYRGLPDYIRLGLEVYDRVDGRTRANKNSPTIEAKESVVIFDSQLGTGDQSRGQFWLGDYQENKLDVSGEGTSGSLDSSRPWTSDYNWSRTESRVDSPSKSDSSLF
ncbi:hypothetical protein [Desulfofustis limnaeus]|nr:hypothetical protein [Desulfofustis limnaeus]